MTDARRQIEKKAGPAVVLVSQMPRAVPFLVVAVLLVGGLLAGGAVGAVLLLVLAALLGTLLVLSWPALQPPARVLRLLVVLLVAARGVAAFWI
ncbi:MAG: DUF6703 family protein [Mycobacteriales bacterium]